MLRSKVSNLSCAHHVLRTSTTKKLWGLRQQMKQKQDEIKQMSGVKEQHNNLKDLEFVLRPPPPPPPLSTRKPSESALSITIPLEKDLDVRAEYINPVGGLRFGKLLEDLDAFACTVAFNHAHDFDRIRQGFSRQGPANIVTATVERIDLMNPIALDHDLTMQGRVSWVGSASMMVKCELLDEKLAKKKLLQSNFLLVTVDEQGKPTACNPLDPESKTEKEEFALVERDNEERRVQRSAMKKANSKIIYDLQRLAMASEETLEVIRQKSKMQESCGKSSLCQIGSIPMRNTIQVATHLTQPQDANTSGNVFGGYLMQKAFEIGWIAAFSFLKRRPKFVCSDDVEFHRPVPAGSICVFTAAVTYVRQPNLIEVSVRCEIMETTIPESSPTSTSASSTQCTTLEKKLTNTFEFIFTPCGEEINNNNSAMATTAQTTAQATTVADVQCESYEDWINYCRGKKVVDDAIQVGKDRGGELRISKLVQ